MSGRGVNLGGMKNDVLETTTADYSSLIHFAQRSDGQWFVRYQRRDVRYGYVWGKWQPSIGPSEDRKPRATSLTARLPKAMA